MSARSLLSGNAPHLVCAGCAVVGAVAVLLGVPWGVAHGWKIGLLVLGFVTFCSTLAGAVAGLASAGYHPLIVGRIGARTGFVTAALIGGLVILFLRAGINIPLLTLAGVILLWAPCALSILPGALAGALACAITARQKAARMSPTSEFDGGAPRFPLFHAAGLVLAAVGFASPILIPHRPTPPKKNAAPVAEPVKVLAPEKEPPPPFRYEPPKDLAAIPANRWDLADTRQIDTFLADSPVALSNDGTLLAYLKDRETVQVMSLHRLEREADWPVKEKIRALAFSPSAASVFYVAEGEPLKVGVLKIQDLALIPLPQPKKHTVPSGQPVWWSDQEVAFHESGNEPLVLNLETLKIDPAEVSPHWKSLPEPERVAWKERGPIRLPSSPAWRFDIQASIASSELPEVEGVPEWPINPRVVFTVSDANHSLAKFFTTIDLQRGDRLLGSFDGSKLLRFRGAEAGVFYFQPRASGKSGFQVAMPHAPDKAPSDQGVPQLVSEAKLCALVFAPLVNPLTNRTIGPERSTVKRCFVSVAGKASKPSFGWPSITPTCARET